MPSGKRGQRSRTLRSGIVIALILVALAFYLSSPRDFLQLENNETHVPLFWLGVEGDEAFSLAFKHSYDKAMYIEHYRIGGGGTILFTGISFKSDLNGQGFIFPDADYRLSKGWGEFKGAHKVMKSIRFIMGSPDQANHTLLIHNKSYFLTRYVKPGTPVAFRFLKRARFFPCIWSVEKWMN